LLKAARNAFIAALAHGEEWQKDESKRSKAVQANSGRPPSGGLFYLTLSNPPARVCKRLQQREKICSNMDQADAPIDHSSWKKRKGAAPTARKNENRRR